MPKLEFSGGAVTIPKPTRAALVESAREWLKMAHKSSDDSLNALHTIEHGIEQRENARKTLRQLERVERILDELAAMEVSE